MSLPRADFLPPAGVRSMQGLTLCPRVAVSPFPRVPGFSPSPRPPAAASPYRRLVSGSSRNGAMVTAASHASFPAFLEISTAEGSVPVRKLFESDWSDNAHRKSGSPRADLQTAQRSVAA